MSRDSHQDQTAECEKRFRVRGPRQGTGEEMRTFTFDAERKGRLSFSTTLSPAGASRIQEFHVKYRPSV